MILDRILQKKRAELAQSQYRLPMEELKERLRDLPPTRSMIKALEDTQEIHIIAEIKRSSPSAGLICKDFDHRAIAKAYLIGGAAAISVLTDREFFGGTIEYISEVKDLVPLPVLRKDFLIHPYQVYESRYYGADAVLLIATILEEQELCDMVQLCQLVGMEPWVEVHSYSDLEKALRSSAQIIGINNRDLSTMQIDLSTTERLLRDIPTGKIVVSESGIKTRDDILRLVSLGVRSFLIGEELMRSRDMVSRLQTLLGVRDQG